MDRARTAKHQRIAVPENLMNVLRWHEQRLPEGPMAESELLFPSVLGGFMGPTTLFAPFIAVAEAVGIKKHITPRAMRRAFRDLASAAEVNDLVTRAVSGHATETMQHHYSTVNASEVSNGLAKVISLAGFKGDIRAAPTVPGGASTAETKTAGSGSNP